MSSEDKQCAPVRVAGASGGGREHLGRLADIPKLYVVGRRITPCELGTRQEAYLYDHTESPGRWCGAAATASGRWKRTANA